MTSEKKLVLATHNKNKVREICEILPDFEVSGEDSGRALAEIKNKIAF